jgi:hypothetical protein
MESRFSDSFPSWGSASKESITSVLAGEGLYALRTHLDPLCKISVGGRFSESGDRKYGLLFLGSGGSDRFE